MVSNCEKMGISSVAAGFCTYLVSFSLHNTLIFFFLKKKEEMKPKKDALFWFQKLISKHCFISCLFFLFSILVLLVSGPFFLLPYFSYSGSYKLTTNFDEPLIDLKSLCKMPPQQSLPFNSHFLFLSMTQMFDLSMKNITLASFLYTSPLSIENQTVICPNGFGTISPWIYHLWNLQNHSLPLYSQQSNHSLYCVQTSLQQQRFLRFTPSDWENDDNYVGFKEKGQSLLHTQFQLEALPHHHTNHSLFLQVMLLDFGTPKQTSFYQPTTSCTDNIICRADFWRGLANETLGIVYEQQSAVCIEETTTCASVIHLGGPSCQRVFWDDDLDDQEDDYDEQCQFTSNILVFPDIPGWITMFSDLWMYNVVSFVPFFCLWLFLGYYLAHSMHQQYLQYYTIHTKLFSLQQHITYQLQLLITYFPFSQAKGLFSLHNYETGDAIEEEELDLHFDAEDYENSKQCTLNKQFEFTSEESVAKVNSRVQWQGEYEQSNFQTPYCQVILQRKYPPLLSSHANVLCMPLFCIVTICNGQFLKRFEYVLIGLFIWSLSMAVVVVVTFAMGFSISLLESLFWSYASQKGVASLLCYSVFVTIILLLQLLALIYFCVHNAPLPMNYDSGKFTSLHIIQNKRRESIVLSEPSHNNRTANKNHVEEVEYVPLEEKAIVLL